MSADHAALMHRYLAGLIQKEHLTHGPASVFDDHKNLVTRLSAGHGLTRLPTALLYTEGAASLFSMNPGCYLK
jgi:hypothetical protein